MLFNCPYVTVPITRSAICDGYTTALGVTLPIAAMVITAIATILIVIAKQLKDARYTLIHSACCGTPPVCMCSLLSRTQLGKLSEPQTNQVYTPGSTYKDVGGASDHTYTPAMELSQCPAYAPTEVSTGRGGRGDVGEEGIYEN